MASPTKISRKQVEENKNLEKLQRKHLQEQQKRIKPGECMKYIRCILDPDFLENPFGSEILSELKKNNIKYIIQRQKLSKIISWERSVQQKFIPSMTDQVAMTEKFTKEMHIIHIITAKDLINQIKAKSIKETVKKLYNDFPGLFVTILIYGLKEFSPQNKYEIEEILTEIQVEYNCCHRYHETSTEVAETIVQFSKAIAEIPFKQQERDKLCDIDTFVLNDNKDTVRVEGTAGLSRLWQNHLTRLPLVTLDVAETIMTEYSNPSKLINAYANVSNEEGIDLLSDLKVRRALGPMQATRRIGPELSRKMHTLYNSLDPNDIL